MIPTDLSMPTDWASMWPWQEALQRGVKSEDAAYWDLGTTRFKPSRRPFGFRGAIPFINWENGPGPSDYWMRDILTDITDVEFRGKQGIHANRQARSCSRTHHFGRMERPRARQ